MLIAAQGRNRNKGPLGLFGAVACLILSNRIFLRQRTLPPWAGTPTDVPPRVPRGGCDRRKSVQSVLRGVCRASGIVYRICTPPRRQSVQPVLAGLLLATLNAR
jgi:hypothetical protein